MNTKSLQQLLTAHKGKTTILTGAGVSTDSGIPCYRGARSSKSNPLTFHKFISSLEYRIRYWKRSYLGYNFIRGAKPNATHSAISELINKGYVHSVITQNVDSLHGFEKVVELHGSLRDVICVDCSFMIGRDEFQVWLSESNPVYNEHLRRISVSPSTRPDGDYNTDELSLPDFHLHLCPICAKSKLKPSVLFFGESMKPSLMNESFARVDNASLLVVMGSSLTVYSAYRLVARALENGSKVVILNKGETRADGLHGVEKFDAWTGDVIPNIVKEL